MLPISKLAFEPPGIAEIFTLPFSSLALDWFGKQLSPAPVFCLALSPESLYFAVEANRPACCDPHPAGSFIEGLWQKDAAEFFLHEEGSSRYQEFNISPTGAWWTQLFSEKRVRDSKFKAPRNVRCLSQISAGTWRAALAVPRRELAISLSWSSRSRINVCFMLGENEQRFLSWSKLPGTAPDFHQPSEFENVLLKEITYD